MCSVCPRHTIKAADFKKNIIKVNLEALGDENEDEHKSKITCGEKPMESVADLLCQCQLMKLLSY